MTTRAVGLSRDLGPTRVMRAEVDGTDIVIWRTSAGEIAAWDNRCPHRGMRLSHGFVRGERLACLYHGWQYGSSGKCGYIPAHPDLDPPETIRTQAYGICEAHGLIWTSASGAPEPDALPEGLEPLRSIVVQSGEDAVHAAAEEAACPQLGLPSRSGKTLTLGPAKIALVTTPLSAVATQVHILASPGFEMTLSRWCEALRRAAEQTEIAA